MIPPAPAFSESFRGRDYEDVIEESNRRKSPAPLSLYLHLPFCERLCYFCGCTTTVT